MGIVTGRSADRPNTLKIEKTLGLHPGSFLFNSTVPTTLDASNRSPVRIVGAGHWYFTRAGDETSLR